MSKQIRNEKYKTKKINRVNWSVRWPDLSSYMTKTNQEWENGREEKTLRKLNKKQNNSTKDKRNIF